jgi:hypothetical protein
MGGSIILWPGFINGEARTTQPADAPPSVIAVMRGALAIARARLEQAISVRESRSRSCSRRLRPG